MKKSLGLVLFFVSAALQAVSVEYKETKKQPGVTDLEVSFILNPHEIIYENSISFSVNTPEVTLSEAKPSVAPVATYDPHFKEHKMVFDENVTFSFQAITYALHHQAITKDAGSDAQIHVLYTCNVDHKPQEKLIPLHFLTATQDDAVNVQQSGTCPDVTTSTQVEGWRGLLQRLKDTVVSTNSWPLRLLFVYLLGLLLSLTPCIYPMIPITVGVLQAQGSKSVLRNFLLSGCYTLGLSTTFSVMGLLAASSGAVFGHIMGNPWFVVGIVALLCYFAFSLFGFYNMYIPRFMSTKGAGSGSGSALSIFTFGMASGMFASPCVSPGLALILAMVAALGSKFLGFILLFVFGIGMSTPLLLIGTFSSSLSLLPQAGMWMIEVQRIFGFLLLSMCFYYLNNILPFYLVTAGLTILLTIIGVYYIYIKQTYSSFWSGVKMVVGIAALAAAAFTFVVTFQEFYYPELNKSPVATSWITDLQEATTKAQQEKKKVLIDFWTPYCSICKSISKNVLQDPAIACVLAKSYVVLMVDASDATLEPYKTLRARYDIQGVPTLVIADPATNKELHRWSSDLYDMPKAEVVEQLNIYAGKQ